MPDQTVPAPYPNTTATATAPLTPDRQPPNSQTTHPDMELTQPSSTTQDSGRSTGK